MGLFDKLKSKPQEEVKNAPVDVDRDGRKLYSDDIVAFVKGEAQKRRSAQQPLEWQWCLNANFFAGNQFCDINPYNGGVQEIAPEKEGQERQAFNRIAPIIETRMANLNKLRYGMVVNPRAEELDDDQKARISTNILRYLTSVSDFAEKRQMLTAWAELCGTAFVWSYWDPDKGEEVGTISVNGEPPKPIKEGDITYTLLTPYEVLPESLHKQTVEEQRSIIIERVMKVDEIEMLYKVKVQGESVDAYTITPVDSGNVFGDFSTSFATKAEKVEDAAKVYVYFEKANATYPNGRMAIVCGEELVHYGHLPYEEIPLVAVKCKDVAGQFFGRSTIQEMIPRQRAYNGCKNKVHDYIKTVAANPLLVPEGSVADIEGLEDEGVCAGKIIEYNPERGKPEAFDYSALPSPVERECENLVQEMEYVAGVSSLMVYGKAPSGVSSGTAIATLNEIDNTRLSITGDNLRGAVKRLAKQWLKLYKQYATGYRVSQISGGNDYAATFTWCAEDINSFDVEFETENELKHSPESQKQAFIEAINLGAFGPPQNMTAETRRKIREALGAGNGFAELLTLDDVQVKQAQSENSMFGRGKTPKIDELDDDDVHISEHTRYALSREFERLEANDTEYAATFRKHIADHKKAKMLKALRDRQEMEALMPMNTTIGGR